MPIAPTPIRSHPTAEALAQQLREAPERFARPADAQDFLKDAGLSITGAILATRLAYDLTMVEAKAVVSAHAAWYREARAGDAMHADLQRMATSHPGLRAFSRASSHPR